MHAVVMMKQYHACHVHDVVLLVTRGEAFLKFHVEVVFGYHLLAPAAAGQNSFFISPSRRTKSSVLKTACILHDLNDVDALQEILRDCVVGCWSLAAGEIIRPVLHWPFLLALSSFVPTPRIILLCCTGITSKQHSTQQNGTNQYS